MMIYIKGENKKNVCIVSKETAGDRVPCVNKDPY